MTAAISWTNKVRDDADGAVAVGTASGSSAFTSNAIDSAYPGSNAVDDDPSRVTQVDYQTGGTAPYESYLEANWTSDATVRAVAALNVRLPSTVVGVRFRVVNAAGTTLETTAQVLAADLVPIPGTTDRYNVYAILSADRSVNRVRFLVQLAASETGYYEVGHLWAGPALVFSGASAGVDADWRLGFVDPSTVSRGNGGGYASYAYPVRRRLAISKRVLSYAEAHGTPGTPSAPSFHQMAMEVGVHSPILVIPRDTDDHTLQRLSVYGLATGTPQIGHQRGDYYGTALEVEEIR